MTLISIAMVARVIISKGFREEKLRSVLIIIMAVVILAAAIVCFCKEAEWFGSLYYLHRVPLFCLLGIAVSFTLIFCLLELSNRGIGCCCLGSGDVAFGHAAQVWLYLEDTKLTENRSISCLVALF